MSTTYPARPSRPESKKSSGKPRDERRGLARMFSSSTRKTKHISSDQLRPITAPSSGTARSLAYLPPPAPPGSPAPTLAGARSSPVPTKLRNVYGGTDSTNGSPERSRPTVNKKSKGTGKIAAEEVPRSRVETSHDQTYGAPGNVRTNNEAHGVPFLAPALHSSPTFPFLRDPPNGLLTATNSALAASRPRGASTSSHTTQSPLRSSRHLERPATAGTEYPLARFQRVQGQKTSLSPTILDAGPLSDDSGYYSLVTNPLEIAGDSDEVRTSFRSALTNSSIYPDTSSTGRSSVGTKDTSISDLGMESFDKLSPKDYLSTVDEAIDMYAAGFFDDDDVECVSPADASAERRLSKSIFDAINESIGPDLLPSVRPLSLASNTNTVLSGRAFPNEPAEPPPLRPPTHSRDQYGFLKAAHQITDAQYDAWNEKYILSQETRVRKWFTYMKDEDLPTYPLLRFPHHCAKTQRFIRKGIPPAWRGAAWFWYAGGHQLLQRDPDLYSTLISCSETALSEGDKEMIERDLHRTFPDNIHFKPDGPLEQPASSRPLPETSLLSSLRRVLRAFAVYCPRIGYCQSLNFITGLLLLFLPEEKTFWMLRIITTEYLPGTHDMSLEGANVDLWVLMSALKDNAPGLWPKIANGDDVVGRHDVRLPPISLCTTSWFMSLFIGTLPIESVLRVWDVLFYEGSRTIFRTALAVFKLGEDRIKAMSDPMEIFQVVQALPRGMLDVGSLMNAVFRRSGITQEWVDKRRKERRKWYAHTRAKSGGGSGGVPKIQRGEIPLPLNNNTTSLLGKADSVWKRRAGQRVRMT